MKTTETIWLDSTGSVCAPGYGEPIDMPRLSPADEFSVLENFRIEQFSELPDSEYDDASLGCRIVYRDDYDALTSEYMCVDRNGNGDGSGEWTAVRR